MSLVKCPLCDGRGFVYEVSVTLPLTTAKVKCPLCNGLKYIKDDKKD